MNDYLSKPIKAAELAAIVAYWLKPGACDLRPAKPGAVRSGLEAPGGNPPDKEEQQEPVLDESVLLDLLGGDKDAFTKITRDFIDDAPRLVEAFRQAVQSADAPLARRHAHTLKGAAANIGAKAVGKIARQAEDRATKGQLDDGLELAGRLDEALAALGRVLQAGNVKP